MRYKMLAMKALEYAEDYDMGKISFEDCILFIMNILKKTLAEKDYQASLIIHKTGSAVLRDYENKERNLDRYLH